jgi:hypothetical protein
MVLVEKLLKKSVVTPIAWVITNVAFDAKKGVFTSDNVVVIITMPKRIIAIKFGNWQIMLVNPVVNPGGRGRFIACHEGGD